LVGLALTVTLPPQESKSKAELSNCSQRLMRQQSRCFLFDKNLHGVKRKQCAYRD